MPSIFGLNNFCIVRAINLSSHTITADRQKIIFMDEPTSGLDAENMRLVSDAVTELAMMGSCLFVITHDYEFAARTFQSLLIIKETKEIVRIPPERYTREILFQKFVSK